MRAFTLVLFSFTLLTARVFAASDVAGDNVPKQKHDYQVCLSASLHRV